MTSTVQAPSRLNSCQAVTADDRLYTESNCNTNLSTDTDSKHAAHSEGTLDRSKSFFACVTVSLKTRRTLV